MEVKSAAEQLFFTTLRIDTIDNLGKKGSGTGFICNHTYAGKEYPFIMFKINSFFLPRTT